MRLQSSRLTRTTEAGRAAQLSSKPAPKIDHSRAYAEMERELCRRDLKFYMRRAWDIIEPSRFVGGWHIDAICDALQAVKDGTLGSRHLIFNIPPRHTKSLTVEVMFPSWMWIDAPATRFLCSSYAEDLSIRDSIKCRSLIQSAWYQHHWGTIYSLSGDQNAKTRFNNDKGGYRLATSVGGMTTGEGGDIILIDDPHNVLASVAISEAELQNTLDWWDIVMPTRLNDPKRGIYILIMQRCHPRDLTGHILAKELDAVHICLPAEYEATHPHRWAHDPRVADGELLCPQRFGAKEIGDLKKKLGTFGASGQLQQRPTPREGGMYKPGWFRIVSAAPAEPRRRIRFWDRAATESSKNLGARMRKANDPDYTAGALVSRTSDGRIYIEHICAFREGPMENERRVAQQAALDGQDVQVFIEQEPGSSGVDSVDHYVRNVINGYAARGKRSTGPKESYIDVLMAQAEAGNVYLVRRGEADDEWIRLLLLQVEQFPIGVHDDLLDAAAKGYCEISLSGVNVRDPNESDLERQVEDNTARAEEQRAWHQGPTPEQVTAVPAGVFRDPDDWDMPRRGISG